MGLTPGRISTSSNITSNSVSNSIQPLYGVVYEVIMDTGSDTAKSKGLDTAASIGCIRFRLLSDNSTNMNTNEQLPVAFPFDKNNFTFPIKGETVVIFQIANQTFLRAFFCSFVILIFKDTNDLLEGISKLDDQIMFSRFQRSVASWRKDPNILNHLN